MKMDLIANSRNDELELLKDIIKEELIACIKFNIDKYNWRKKGQDVEDFKKIIDYAKFAIEVLKGEK